MARLSDKDRLWRIVQDVAAEHGWHDRAEVLRVAHLRALREGQHGEVYTRLERLWAERAETAGPC